MESEFQTWKRYKHHTRTKDELGMQKLLRIYQNEGLYEIKSGRKITNQADHASDVYDDGTQALAKPMARWVSNRTYTRSTRQDFSQLPYDSDGDVDMDAEEQSGTEGERED